MWYLSLCNRHPFLPLPRPPHIPPDSTSPIISRIPSTPVWESCMSTLLTLLQEQKIWHSQEVIRWLQGKRGPLVPCISSEYLLWTFTSNLIIWWNTQYLTGECHPHLNKVETFNYWLLPLFQSLVSLILSEILPVSLHHIDFIGSLLLLWH